MSAILVFGDIQDVMPLKSDTPEGWIENLVEWNDGQHVANWYLSDTGERFEGAGWDTPVHWGNPSHPYEYINSRYVLYLGDPFSWTPEVQDAAREIVERHAELYSSDRVGIHCDLDHSSIRGRESMMKEWTLRGSPPVPKGVKMSSHVITKGNVNPENGELYPAEYGVREGSAVNELEVPEEQEDPNTIPGTTVTLSDEDAEVVGGEEAPPAPVAPQPGEVEEEEAPPEPEAKTKPTTKASSSE